MQEAKTTLANRRKAKNLGSKSSDVKNRSLIGLVTLSGIRSPLEFRVVHVNGIALHVVLAGPATGKPLVFLHGFPEFWYGWRRQIDRFVSLGYRVIIPDQRGYNLSDKPGGITNYSIDLLAKDVVGVLDAVTNSKAFVVGHDYHGCDRTCSRRSTIDVLDHRPAADLGERFTGKTR